jgi:hypothetical protein
MQFNSHNKGLRGGNSERICNHIIVHNFQSNHEKQIEHIFILISHNTFEGAFMSLELMVNSEVALHPIKNAYNRYNNITNRQIRILPAEKYTKFHNL